MAMRAKEISAGKQFHSYSVLYTEAIMGTLSSPSPEIIRFGVYELNVRTNELRKHGIRLRMQEQPLQVLLTLLERSGELVTREEIRNRVWPQNTFVSFDHALNT